MHNAFAKLYNSFEMMAIGRFMTTTLFWIGLEIKVVWLGRHQLNILYFNELCNVSGGIQLLK